jgi:hypothetical protein
VKEITKENAKEVFIAFTFGADKGGCNVGGYVFEFHSKKFPPSHVQWANCNLFVKFPHNEWGHKSPVALAAEPQMYGKTAPGGWVFVTREAGHDHPRPKRAKGKKFFH